MTDPDPAPADPAREPGSPNTPVPRAEGVSPARLRASDADRDQVAERLREAVAEGRLDLEEFGERLEAAYEARTYGELELLTRDLPAVAAAPVSMVKSSAPGAGPNWPARIGGEPTSTFGVAIMSGFDRKGRWTAPRRFNALTVMGGGVIDLRDADFEDREVVINVIAVMGGVDVIVPPGVEVISRGVGIMGGFDHPEPEEHPVPGAPRVIVTGFAFWGGVGVRRKVTRAEKERLKAERRREKLERRRGRSDRRELPGGGAGE
ncbi:DUF1707 SHOCT-like domain-containing protein [Streptomyces sp. LE64]|uniref:DUF1707 SHOCT-like domain-containing protein n=1 Tax=Streptomyces sp. LE64 TaxID=3448653 RepID=UPI0040417565